MSLPFLNTAPGYDEELRNSVFSERGLHATSICGAVGAAVAVAMLQGQDELPRVVFKPYPCNHFTHAGVDAAPRLRAQGLASADVTAIELGVVKPVLRTIAEPPETKARPGLRVPRGVQRPLHGRRGAAARRSRTPSPPSCA
jgi:2-methylcitrate dehydratase PrpD